VACHEKTAWAAMPQAVFVLAVGWRLPVYATRLMTFSSVEAI